MQYRNKPGCADIQKHSRLIHANKDFNCSQDLSLCNFSIHFSEKYMTQLRQLLCDSFTIQNFTKNIPLFIQRFWRWALNIEITLHIDVIRMTTNIR